MSQYRKTVILRRRLAIYHEPFRPPAYFGGQGFAVEIVSQRRIHPELGHSSKKIGLPAQRRCKSHCRRLFGPRRFFTHVDNQSPIERRKPCLLTSQHVDLLQPRQGMTNVGRFRELQPSLVGSRLRFARCGENHRSSRCVRCARR
jgi:hypothetical protein